MAQDNLCKLKRPAIGEKPKCELCDGELSKTAIVVRLPKFGLSYQCCRGCARAVFKVNL